MLVVGHCVALPEGTALYPLIGQRRSYLCDARRRSDEKKIKSLNSLYLQQGWVKAVVRIELQDT